MLSNIYAHGTVIHSRYYRLQICTMQIQGLPHISLQCLLNILHYNKYSIAFIVYLSSSIAALESYEEIYLKSLQTSFEVVLCAYRDQGCTEKTVKLNNYYNKTLINYII